MNIEEIRDSGLLELYVLGTATSQEIKIVKDAIIQFPELISEIKIIEATLLNYAKIYAVTPSAGLKDSVLKSISKNTTTASTVTNIDPQKSKNSGILSWLLLASCLGLIGAYFILNKNNSALKEKYNQKVIACDSISNVQAEKIAILENIQNKDIIIIELAPTEKYPEAQLYLHNNTKTKKNFLQIKNLPALASDQSFQLWALKGTDAPRPLDVFETDRDNIFEVQFVDSPDAYAITIEPRGGQKSPTLENLIGVISVAG